MPLYVVVCINAYKTSEKKKGDQRRNKGKAGTIRQSGCQIWPMVSNLVFSLPSSVPVFLWEIRRNVSELRQSGRQIGFFLLLLLLPPAEKEALSLQILGKR